MQLIGERNMPKFCLKFLDMFINRANPGKKGNNIMGAKTFHNQTNLDLSVQLEVRKGDKPGNTLCYKNYSLASGDSRYCEYSDSRNPYLDGILINGVNDDEMIASQQFVFHRGGPGSLDAKFNTHNTVTITMSANKDFDLSFSNS